MDVLQCTKRGLFCAAGDFYIDPWRPVARAAITHGHADHARPGMGAYLCTQVAAPVMRHRLGDIAVQTCRFGETVEIGEARVSFHPAGHVPGSAQIRVEVGGEVWVVSGDYKLEADGLSEAFEPVPCHTFITESTFGLPVFRWRPQSEIADQIAAWWRDCAAQGQTAFLGCYALGKAQRLLRLLNPGQGPILCHGAIEATNAILRGQRIALPDTIHASADLDRSAYTGAIVLAPPSALGSAWARKFGRQQTAFASGWMALRGIRRRRAGDRGFVISDHADWPGLLGIVEASGARSIGVTHGSSEPLARYLAETRGLETFVVPTRYRGEAEEEVQSNSEGEGE